MEYLTIKELNSLKSIVCYFYEAIHSFTRHNPGCFDDIVVKFFFYIEKKYSKSDFGEVKACVVEIPKGNVQKMHKFWWRLTSFNNLVMSDHREVNRYREEELQVKALIRSFRALTLIDELTSDDAPPKDKFGCLMRLYQLWEELILFYQSVNVFISGKEQDIDCAGFASDVLAKAQGLLDQIRSNRKVYPADILVRADNFASSIYYFYYLSKLNEAAELQIRLNPDKKFSYLAPQSLIPWHIDVAYSVKMTNEDKSRKTVDKLKGVFSEFCGECGDFTVWKKFINLQGLGSDDLKCLKSVLSLLHGDFELFATNFSDYFDVLINNALNDIKTFGVAGEELDEMLSGVRDNQWSGIVGKHGLNFVDCEVKDVGSTEDDDMKLGRALLRLSFYMAEDQKQEKQFKQLHALYKISLYWRDCYHMIDDLIAKSDDVDRAHKLFVALRHLVEYLEDYQDCFPVVSKEGVLLVDLNEKSRLLLNDLYYYLYKNVENIFRAINKPYSSETLIKIADIFILPTEKELAEDSTECADLVVMRIEQADGVVIEMLQQQEKRRLSLEQKAQDFGAYVKMSSQQSSLSKLMSARLDELAKSTEEEPPPAKKPSLYKSTYRESFCSFAELQEQHRIQQSQSASGGGQLIPQPKEPEGDVSPKGRSRKSSFLSALSPRPKIKPPVTRGSGGVDVPPETGRPRRRSFFGKKSLKPLMEAGSNLEGGCVTNGQ
ncbi:MAG: hypothetical protein KAS93_04485 [Gammaproteobacteria bacterium]|nr:hypothetical protein [Gammaproteobacteria bacterium]